MNRKKTDASEDTEVEAALRLEPERPDPDAPQGEASIRESVLVLSRRLDTSLWEFAAAAALHRWGLALHHTGSWPALTEADFCAALDAACKPPGHRPVPHPPALFQET
ncbi:MAG: hypothetical protein R3B07_35750 [Polyangiaceae bacterium]